MIVVDIETSRLDFNKCGIWQIGALELENPENTFLEDAKIDYKDKIEEGALKVTGKTEGELMDKSKQSQKQMIEHLFEWMKSIKIKNFICENPQFDLGFITIKAKKYGLNIPFPHRCFDLHSLCSLKYFELNKEFLMKDDKSNMGLSSILKFCGIPDKRIKVEGNEVLKEGTPHNALEYCKLETEAFSRLIYGKSLLPEFAKFKVPEYLQK